MTRLDYATISRLSKVLLHDHLNGGVRPGPVRDLAEHPVEVLRRPRFRVTVNTDCRLSEPTLMSTEFTQLSNEFGYDLDTLGWFTVNGWN